MSASTCLRPFLLLAALAFLAPTASAQRESPFMDEFRKLMQIHDVDAMAALVKKNEPQAILAVRDIVRAIGAGSNDILEGEIDALGKAWRKAYDTQFVQVQYDFFALRLTGPFKRHHKDLMSQYEIKRREYLDAREKKETAGLAALGLEFDERFGDGFAELGDDYLAAECYRAYAECFDEKLAGDRADLRRACEGWKLFLEARDRCELKDSSYSEAKARFDKLEYDGYGDPSKGPEARAAAKAASDASYQPKPIGASFQLVPDIEAIQRPMYTADSNFQLWATVALGKVDSTAVIPTMEKSPTILRAGAAKAAVDVNGDGKGDVEIPLTGKISPVQVTLGEGESLRSWAFLAVIGQERDKYQGFDFNLAPDDNQMNIYVAAAGSLAGMVGETRIQVIDDNLDGLYGSAPKDWAYVGLLEGVYQRDMDTVVIGESKVARPWSRLQKIGDSWYKLEPAAGGADLVVTRTDVETGTLQLDLKGPPVTWLVLRGTGNNQELFYDVVNGGTNKVEVPIGSYELFAGQVATGKKAQMAKALVLPGKNSRSWAVKSGETTKLELGAPFDIDFKVTQDDATITVDGNSVAVVGRGNETYQRLWNCVLSPEVNLRKAGTSKGKKETKLTPITSQEQLQDHANDYRVAWFPVGTPIEKPSSGDKFEAQLFEKKHKLFGKLESSWRGE